MAPPNPKRPPRPPRPPGQQAPSDDSGEELPFDDDEVAPLQADDPRPQRVPQYPAGPRRLKRRGPGERAKSDRELSPRYDWAKEYSDPGVTPAFLYVERGPGAGQLVPLRQGSITLGRSSTSDLRLQHASISRRHAQLTRRGNVFLVRDLGSQNGTFLNRIRIKGEVEIRPGDELSLGNATLRLRGAGAPPTTSRTSVDPVPPRKSKRPFKAVAIAVAAVVVGSAVAAVISAVAMRTPSEEPVRTEGTTGEKQQAAGGAGAVAPESEAPTDETSASAEATSGERPVAAPTKGSGAASASEVARGARSAGKVPTGTPAPSDSDIARGGPAPRPPAPSASDIARGVRPSDAAPAARTAAPSATDIARGGPSPDTAPAAKTEAHSASDIARGVTASDTAPATKAEAHSASDIARGRQSSDTAPAAKAEAHSASDIARGRQSPTVALAKSDAPHGSEGAQASSHRKPAAADAPLGDRLRTDVLSRYESGDVSGALAQARRANLPDLVQQLTRFQTAEANARAALASQDHPRALDALGAAVRLDLELSQGWSKQGANLRRQLSGLYVRTGRDAVRAQRYAEARAAFTSALQHDASNAEAREQLAALDARTP
jgi:pSer/pThr/pTyr-binding forkhead associated (FHA) protein